MTRDGLTEENLRDGSVKDISHRSRGRPENKEEFVPERERKKAENEDSKSGKGKRLQMEKIRKSSVRQEAVEDTVEVTPEEKVSGYRKKLHRHEKIPDDDNNLNSQKKSIRKKQLQKQMTKEQAKAGRLFFDDEGNQMVKGAGMKPGGTAGKYIATQAVISGMKAVTSEEEETDENAGVESARLAERETEAALRGLRHAQIRSKRTDVKTHRKGYREATVEKKLKFGSAESMEGVKHAESVKNAEQKRHFYNRFFQKKRYKDAYRAARAGKSAGSLGGATTIAGVENMTVKAKIALKEIIKRNRAMFAGIGTFALLFLVIAVSLGSCSASIEGAGSVIGITTYPSSDEDIYAAENRYAALESALNQQINEMERRHPNYDEYQCFGHLVEYVSPDVYDEKFSQWRYEDLPIIPKDWKVTVSEDKKDQFYILKRLLNSPEIEYVVNACDAGREGELIFKHVYDLSGSKKPVKRLWISSLEDSAILDGMQHLRSAEEYRHLAEAAVCRSQADWLVGMNATRAYTTKYFKKLTVGRVQTPTLAMLVERAGQISNFQKEKYFNVELDCDGIPAIKPKIFDPDEAEQLRSRCQGSEASISAVKETEKKVKAPKLYDLTTLQREANRIYGMTAKQTLDTAQSLYEKKLITYPRTDSQYLTEDMEQTARNVVRQIYEKYQLTGPFDQPEQPDVKKVMNNSKVTDHHAIIPTMELASCHLDELKSWEEKILFLIAVHTVMAMSKDHIYQETEIEVECQEEIFKAKGKTVLQDGWKLFENCFKNKDRMAIVDPDQEMKERMPKVTQGQTFYAVAAEKTEHFTSPPKPYSEDTLLAAMETAGNKEFDEDTEKKGLGTPATRAGIIEKLIYSQYATRKGKKILPTDDGKVLVEILPDFLKSASMTAEWENQLLLMEHGEIAPEQFMTGIKNMLSMMLNGCDAISEEETRRFQTRESIGTCPVCGSLVYESKPNFYCSNHDCHFALWKDNRYLQSMEKTMDKKMAAELLKSGCVHVKDLYSRKKNMYFEADLHMDTDETGRVNFSLSFPKKKPKNKSKKK